MRGCKFLIALAVFAFVRPGAGDTLDLMGGTNYGWTIGWFGEAWKDTGWCGDTLSKDSLGAVVLTCDPIDFAPDTGGLTAGQTYINFNYKFRNYYSQLPIVFSNWSGMDARGYKYLRVVYKGLLPSHRISIEFFYTGGPDSATDKNINKHGDGVGSLSASPTGWKTAILQIPDSVDLENINGIVFAIGNAPGLGGKTSEVGNLKVDRVSLLPDPSNLKYRVDRKIAVNNRFYFTPSSGSVAFTVYSLKGEAMVSKKVIVQSGKKYPVRRFFRDNCGVFASQVRLMTIKGEGVGVNARMW